MRFILAFIAPMLAFAVDGTVVNQTNGQPQANVIITLIQPGQGGMQTLGSTKSDTQGKFTIDKPLGEGPGLLQALYAGVTYTKTIQPGTPPTGIELAVYDSTTKQVNAEMNQHMVLLQPSDTGIQVNEMLLMRNKGKVTFNDPSNGTVRFYVPPGSGQIRVMVSAPGGMPVQRPAEPAGPADTYKVLFPIKPGETRFDITYKLESASKEYTGKRLIKGGESRVVIPAGVTLEGEGLEQLGTEPTTKAKIYGVQKDSYTVKLSGAGSLSAEAPGGAAPAEGGAQRPPEEDTGQLPLQQTNPRIYEQLPTVLALSGAVLLLGFIVLYRSKA